MILSLLLPLLVSQTLPPLPRLTGRDIGALNEQDLMGFARVPGKGRVALLSSNEFIAYEHGRLVHYPVTLPSTMHTLPYDIADTDGDGIDEIVALGDSPTSETTAEWRHGAYVNKDLLAIEPYVGYDSSILVPDGDHRPAWLLLTWRDTNDKKNFLPGTLVAYRRVSGQWKRMWAKPLFGRSGIAPARTQVYWHAAFDGRVVLDTSSGELARTRDVVCIALHASGFTTLWRTTEKMGTGTRPVRTMLRTVGVSSRFVRCWAFNTPEDKRSRNELLEYTDTGEVARAELPADTKEIWEPQPGVRLLVVGNRVLLTPATEGR